VIANHPNGPWDVEAIEKEWQRMLANPTGLARPLVVLSGWRSPAISGRSLAARLRRLTGADPEMVLPVSFWIHGDFDSMVATVIRRVERRWPAAAHSGRTTSIELDVVGISMGGLIARAAAAPAAARRYGLRLAISTLYTLGTPHRGAKLANVIALDSAARCMRPGSPWLQRLDEAYECADYRTVAYARLNDHWVGAGNCAPWGEDPIWFPGPIFGSHELITLDKRILTDLARRLRGEDPIAHPIGPPPHD